MARTTRTALLAALALLAATASPAAAKLRQISSGSPLGNEQLSDEKTITRWASPFNAAPIRSAPSASARKVGKLHFHTEDGPGEIYLALQSRLDRKGRAWIQIRLLGRPNGRKGWVRESDLSTLNVVRTMLKIDRKHLRATLFRKGKKVWSSPIGVGKASTPTPAGNFYIRERLKGFGGGGAYGPFAFGTSAYSGLSDWPGGGVIGIHGTNEPQLIPGRPSHGCIRVPNAKVLKLAKLMPIGTPVRIV